MTNIICRECQKDIGMALFAFVGTVGCSIAMIIAGLMALESGLAVGVAVLTFVIPVCMGAIFVAGYCLWETAKIEEHNPDCQFKNKAFKVAKCKEIQMENTEKMEILAIKVIHKTSIGSAQMIIDNMDYSDMDEESLLACEKSIADVLYYLNDHLTRINRAHAKLYYAED